jgi:hypothetical protein
MGLAGWRSGKVHLGGAGFSHQLSTSDFDQSNHSAQQALISSTSSIVDALFSSAIDHHPASPSIPVCPADIRRRRGWFSGVMFLFFPPTSLSHIYVILHYCGGMKRLKGGEPQHGSKFASL